MTTLRWSPYNATRMICGMSPMKTRANPIDNTSTVRLHLISSDLISHRPPAEYGLVTAEAMTLAQQLVNHETTRTKLINDGFNRYSMNSKDDLPTWFLDDESKHYKPNLPVTKEAMAALRAKQRALDARPIKKIAEAKARKKFKAHQRLEKAIKKAEGVNTTEDLSEKEKAQQIDKLMRKGLSSGQKVKKDISVVVARGPHKGVKGRPKGVKGRYSMVDARMRKEVSFIHIFCDTQMLIQTTDTSQEAGREGQQKAQEKLDSGASRTEYLTPSHKIPLFPAEGRGAGNGFG